MEITNYAPPEKNKIVYKDAKSNFMSAETIGQFLNLFVEQLKNQDPLSPMENTEFMNQTAMMTSVEQLLQLNTSTTKQNEYLSEFGNNTATALLGKDVLATQVVNEQSTDITGRVLAVDYKKGEEPTLTLDTGDKVKLSEIKSVAQFSSTANNSAT